MRARTPENQRIYEATIWLLLAGRITPSQVARRYGMGRSTPGMWLKSAREKLGGKELAKKKAELVITGKLKPTGRGLIDIEPRLLDRYLQLATDALQACPTNSFVVEKSLRTSYNNLLLNAQGQIERGHIRYVKQDCSGRPIELNREHTPEELLLLVEVLKQCQQLDDLLEERKLRRSKRYKLLAKNEQEVLSLKAEYDKRGDALAVLLNQYRQRLGEMKNWELRLEAREAELAA